MKIIVVGKLKEKYLKEASDEYLKRLTKYININLIEIEDMNDTSKSLELESEKILKNISPKDFVVTLEIEGKELTSLELSDKINTWPINNLVFVIGSSNGLSNEVKERSNYQLSFSKMTFPHQLFRIMLLEQIYRAFKILNNEKYHK